MTKVFVPHMVTRYNPAYGKVVPALNFTDAYRFGELKFILPDQDYKAEDFDVTIGKALIALQEVTREDYFIPTGDPTLIALCAAEIARRTGGLNILRWERTKLIYTPTKVRF